MPPDDGAGVAVGGHPHPSGTDWLTTAPSRLLRVHHLELGERFVPPSPVLVPDPARLGPAERCEGRDVHVLVHPAGPRLELADHLRAARHVSAPYGSAESVVGAV